MMINKRLLDLVPESTKPIHRTVFFQWLGLLCNIVMIFAVTGLLSELFYKEAELHELYLVILISLVTIVIRFFATKLAAKESFEACKTVKSRLREQIYQKVLKLGGIYHKDLNTSEVVQVAVEGVDQLETYFGSYLPQFYYSMLAPITLFAVLSFVNFPAALVMLICVPLIPITIAMVQTIAKKLLSKYWNQYTTLGDTFLENLQGLTTLKIYQADEMKHQKMNEESERFRKITMKVLTMQLNSITIMDIIAYGGSVVGIIVAATQFAKGSVTFGGGLAIILLAADFFIPMRMLGSYFHIAMNGMAASDKIFRLLDLEEPERTGTLPFPDTAEVIYRDVHFSYVSEREILHGVNMEFKSGSMTAIVGESGCGKSTVAGILMRRNRGFSGDVFFGDRKIQEIEETELLKEVTYVGFESYLFKGTVEDNLRMARPKATEEELWKVLERVKLSDFLKSEDGLKTVVMEQGSNLSGGQRQRLALARAVLKDSAVYVFDEATSNVDAESENDIMDEIRSLAKRKTVILITHRLANAKDAANIFVMDQGSIAESGSHEELLLKNGIYARLWQAQSRLERYERGDKHAETK